MPPAGSKPPAPTCALVFSGGNALAAYQAGAYEAFHAAGLPLHWIAGTSSGAINAALIAGSRPEDRVAALQDFWSSVAGPEDVVPGLRQAAGRRAHQFASAAQTILLGQRNLFAPRLPMPSLLSDDPQRLGRYDPGPMQETVERRVDFDRVDAGGPRLTVNATDLITGETVFFDSSRERITARHILASAALPPDLPPVEIDGRLLCDGGMSVNVAVEALLETPPPGDMVCIVVDLFGPRRAPPRSFDDLLELRHDLPFATQSRRTLHALIREYRLRAAVHRLGAALPAKAKSARDLDPLLAEGSDVSILLLHLRYGGQADALAAKVYDYAPSTLRDRWAAGRTDMAHCLTRIAEALSKPRAPGLRLLEVQQPDGMRASA